MLNTEKKQRMKSCQIEVPGTSSQANYAHLGICVCKISHHKHSITVPVKLWASIPPLGQSMQAPSPISTPTTLYAILRVIMYLGS